MVLHWFWHGLGMVLAWIRYGFATNSWVSRPCICVIASAGSGWIWLALAGYGWLWLALAGSGWLWLALATLVGSG